MTEAELDEIYGRLCESLTAAGEAAAPLILARFALLAMVALGDAGRVRELIAEACSSVDLPRARRTPVVSR